MDRTVSNFLHTTFFSVFQFLSDARRAFYFSKHCIKGCTFREPYRSHTMKQGAANDSAFRSALSSSERNTFNRSRRRSINDSATWRRVMAQLLLVPPGQTISFCRRSRTDCRSLVDRVEQDFMRTIVHHLTIRYVIRSIFIFFFCLVCNNFLCFFFFIRNEIIL